jgi:hypothetical protein
VTLARRNDECNDERIAHGDLGCQKKKKVLAYHLQPAYIERVDMGADAHSDFWVMLPGLLFILACSATSPIVPNRLFLLSFLYLRG